MANCVTLGSRLTSFRKLQVRVESPNNRIWTVCSGDYNVSIGWGLVLQYAYNQPARTTLPK